MHSRSHPGHDPPSSCLFLTPWIQSHLCLASNHNFIGWLLKINAHVYVNTYTAYNKCIFPQLIHILHRCVCVDECDCVSVCVPYAVSLVEPRPGQRLGGLCCVSERGCDQKRYIQLLCGLSTRAVSPRAGDEGADSQFHTHEQSTGRFLKQVLISKLWFLYTSFCSCSKDYVIYTILSIQY